MGVKFGHRNWSSQLSPPVFHMGSTAAAHARPRSSHPRALATNSGTLVSELLPRSSKIDVHPHVFHRFSWWARVPESSDVDILDRDHGPLLSFLERTTVGIVGVAK